jgi:hypothetical protein
VHGPGRAATWICQMPPRPSQSFAMSLRSTLSLLAVLAAATTSTAAPAPAITVESNVPPYTLPDSLVCTDGTPVRDSATWQ